MANTKYDTSTVLGAVDSWFNTYDHRLIEVLKNYHEVIDNAEDVSCQYFWQMKCWKNMEQYRAFVYHVDTWLWSAYPERWRKNADKSQNMTSLFCNQCKLIFEIVEEELHAESIQVLDLETKHEECNVEV